MLSCDYSTRRCPAGNIWKDFDTQWKTPERVLGLEVTCAALKAADDSCFSISTWQVSRGRHVCLLRGSDKMSGLHAQCGFTATHSKPLCKQLQVSRPFLSIQAFFFLKQSHWPSQRKYSEHCMGKGEYEMRLFSLQCLDYKQIFTPVLGLRLMENSANYLKQTHFHTFHSCKSFWHILPRLKIKTQRREREKYFVDD